MARSRLADQVGRVVGGRYRLLAPVGTGASADVYVADDVTLRRRVAVKVLHDALAADAGFLRRFRAEARAVASLRHPNIMAVYDWGEEADGPFLVLEYLGGGSLRDLLDRGHRLTPAQAVLAGLDVARGLDHAHRRGLVHRDVKPANLLFDDEGRLAIADFGIARALAEATWTEPAGAVVGTVRYASPEQARGTSLDGRADVYALALVLVEAVTGRVPFAADTTIATLMARLDRPIPVPTDLGALGPVIEAAGAVDPADRVDAAGLVRALEAASHRLPRPAPLPLAPRGDLPLPEDEADEETAAFGSVLAGGDHVSVRFAEPADLTTLGQITVVEPAVRSSADGVAPDPPPRGGEPARAPRRWRWWRWLVPIVLLAGVAAAGAFLVAARSPGPTYPVVDLHGQLIADVIAHPPPHFRVAVHDVREGPPLFTVLRQDVAAGRHRAGTITVDVSISRPYVSIPDLGGLTQDQAQARLQSAALGFGPPAQDFSDTVPPGHVIRWTPANIQIEEGTAVTVTLSGGRRVIPMPNAVGQPYAQAVAALQSEGVTNVAKAEAFSDTVAVGSVISTDPAAGAPVDRTTTATLTVSKGPDIVTVPSVAGLPVGQAQAAVANAGLTTAGTYGPPGATTVQFTRPAAGSRVKRGSGVVLYTG